MPAPRTSPTTSNSSSRREIARLSGTSPPVCPRGGLTSSGSRMSMDPLQRIRPPTASGPSRTITAARPSRRSAAAATAARPRHPTRAERVDNTARRRPTRILAPFHPRSLPEWRARPGKRERRRPQAHHVQAARNQRDGGRPNSLAHRTIPPCSPIASRNCASPSARNCSTVGKPHPILQVEAERRLDALLGPGPSEHRLPAGATPGRAPTPRHALQHYVLALPRSAEA